MNALSAPVAKCVKVTLTEREKKSKLYEMLPKYFYNASNRSFA